MNDLDFTDPESTAPTIHTVRTVAPVREEGPAALAPYRPPAELKITGRTAPHSLEAEEYLLSCCLLDGADVVARCVRAKIGPQSFYLAAHGIVFERLLSLKNRGIPIDVAVLAEDLKAERLLTVVGGFGFITQISSRIPTTAQAGYFIEKFRELYLLREMIRAATGAVEECYAFSGDIAEFTTAIQEKVGDVARLARGPDALTDELQSRLDARRFCNATPPDEPASRFLINGRSVCTPGNLTCVIAQAKSGKSAFISAMLSAAICAEFGDSQPDTLGISATAPGRRSLLHFDTEQSVFDHDQLVRRALKRAGVESPPAWLESYGLAGFSAVDLRRTLILLMKAATANGGLFAVIVDGAADMVTDVNDAEESNAFVAELQSLAIEHDCPIIGVVHENPGQDGGKMRGHLGSQLERKAESNLRLRKADEVTVVFSEKMRKAPILEKDGPRFRWSEAEGMHVSCESAGRAKDDAKRDKSRELAEEVFAHLGKTFVRFSELVKAIGEVRKVGASAAEDRYSEMKRLGVISKCEITKLWTLSKSNSPVAPSNPVKDPVAGLPCS